MNQTQSQKKEEPDVTVLATTELQRIADEFAVPYGQKVGVYVTDLSNGATATVNADQQFVTASIYKLYIAYAVYNAVDKGTLSLTKVLDETVDNKTVDQCLDVMITVSDNPCGSALGFLVGWREADQLAKAMGASSTIINNPTGTDKQTTARDTALLLSRLYHGTLLSKVSTAQFIQYLKDDEINTYLPSGLPTGTVIAHKIGYLYGFVHDAGIIYGPKKDVLVVLLTGEWSNPWTDAPPVFADLSSQLWLYMNDERF